MLFLSSVLKITDIIIGRGGLITDSGEELAIGELGAEVVFKPYVQRTDYLNVDASVIAMS